MCIVERISTTPPLQSYLATDFKERLGFNIAILTHTLNIVRELDWIMSLQGMSDGNKSPGLA